MTQAPPLWKASVPLTKSEAADVAALLELASSPQAVLVSEEPFEDSALVEALYAQMPDGDLLSRLLRRPVHVSLLPDADWIKLSQEGLPPVRAGRFFVYGAHDAGAVPAGVIPIRIEAGLAFGTGHHETTALCLAVLSDLAKRRRFANVLDLGCGTGLLAIGAAKLWHRKVLATDIDPVAVEVCARERGGQRRRPLVRTAVADGMQHPAIAAGRALRPDRRQYPGRTAHAARARHRGRARARRNAGAVAACCAGRKILFSVSTARMA